MFTQIKELFRQRKERNKKLFHRNNSFYNLFTNASKVSKTPSNNSTKVSNSVSTKEKAKSIVIESKSTTKKATNKNATLANRLVVESNKRKSQLPNYMGLERFELVKKLGEGAFSNVFEARDLETGKNVALKVAQKSINKAAQQHLHSSLIKKPRVTERANIIKEVQIMKQIKHPNIVKLIHYTETKENYVIALELCQGGELFHQIVKLTYFSEQLSRHVIVQVAEAVRYLHEELGVVHRDIKPENILYDPIPIVPSKERSFRPTDNRETKLDEGEFQAGLGGGGIGRVKLADFGLSKVIWDSSTFTPCGTVGYTAPEIVKDKTYSKSVDMWAIGCVLYTILCGFPPFYDESIPELTAKVARGQYTFLSPWWDTMSDSVKDLISHLLCVDVQKRYTIDQFFNHPWILEEPFIRQGTINKKPSPVSQKIKKTWDENEISNYTTPDATTLRGIFDVTYAVQRMEEEETSPVDTKIYQKQDIPETQKRQNLPLAKALAKKNLALANPAHFPHTHQTHHDYPLPLHQNIKTFELNLNKATLLNNRKPIQT